MPHHLLSGFKQIVKMAVITCAFQASSQAAIMYSAENAGNSAQLNPIQKAESASDFYNYNSLLYPFSGNPDFGSASNVGLFWLYEDTTNNELSLGMMFDQPKDGSGGKVRLESSGLPDTSYIPFKDDPNDRGKVLNGTASWRWYSCCNDGTMVSGLENTEWVITLDLLKSTGIDQWYLLNGPSTDEPDTLRLNMNQNLVLTATQVPEASPLILMSMGLLGLGWLVRSRKRSQ